jgi:hypothetical protein
MLNSSGHLNKLRPVQATTISKVWHLKVNTLLNRRGILGSSVFYAVHSEAAYNEDQQELRVESCDSYQLVRHEYGKKGIITVWSCYLATTHEDYFFFFFFFVERPNLFAICNNTFSKWWEG